MKYLQIKIDNREKLRIITFNHCLGGAESLLPEKQAVELRKKLYWELYVVIIEPYCILESCSS